MKNTGRVSIRDKIQTSKRRTSPVVFRQIRVGRRRRGREEDGRKELCWGAVVGGRGGVGGGGTNGAESRLRREKE